MRSFEVRQEIEAPIEAAWSCMSTVDAWPDWLPTVRSVEPLQVGPLAVGARYRLRQPKLPAVVWRVSALDPGRSFAWESRTPGTVSLGEHELAARGPDSCTVVLRLTLSGPFSGLAARIGGHLIREYVELEARSLRKTVELRARTVCAFCGQGIRATAVEPLRLAIRLPDGGQQTLFAHVDCVGTRLHPGTPWLSKRDREVMDA